MTDPRPGLLTPPGTPASDYHAPGYVAPSRAARGPLPAAPPPSDLRPATGPPPALADLRSWRRMHPLSPLVRTGARLGSALVLLALISVGRDNIVQVVAELAGVVVVGIVGFISWLVTRWAVIDGVLCINTGLLRRRSYRYPLVRVQAVDIDQTGVARVLGLAALRLRMAGAGGAKGHLAWLPLAEANALRGRLLALAHGLDEATPVPPSRDLYRLSTARLVGATALSGPVLVLLALLGVVIGIAETSKSGLGAAGSLLAYIVAVVLALWRRFSGSYHLTVGEAPDGLRINSGLVQITAETLPYARIQAVRMRQPLLWRPLGWVHLSVEVAGGRSREGNKDESRTVRTLMPVGTRREALSMLGRILPDPPEATRRPPARARWKSPLRYPHLRWGHDDRCVVTVSGRIRVDTHWVPLTKVQSIRRVQGPLQRRFALSTVHLDTPGRVLHAAAIDQDASIMEAQVEELTRLCRRARRAH